VRPRAFLFVCALSVPALIGAGTGRAASIRLSKTPLDTILRPDLDRPPLTVRMGLVADPSEPHVRMGLRRIPVSSEALGGGPGPEPFGVDGDVPRLAGPRPGPRLALPGWIEEELMADVLRFRVADLERPGADSALFLPPAAPPRTPPPEPAAGATERFVTEYADLAMRVRSRMELGGDWARFEPCEADFKATCTPGLVPQLSPEFLFGVQVDGSIADRVRVDVDFDQAREFDAANRINIFYEGREDDIIRRLDVGDVTFRMPRSRFLTEGLPAGNFGFQAEGQLGPIDFQGVWAQQRGDLNTRVFRLSGVGDQRGFVQADTIVLDDADFVQGQFFFLLDPALLDGWPHVDVLSLDPSAAPLGQVPDGSPIQLYRFEDDATLQQQVDGLIQAEAVAVSPTDTLVEAGWFRYLQPGVDYFTHASGLWVALRTPLRDDEMLAVTYITATGDTIGDYNPERLHNAGQRPNLRLLKASGSNHRPGRASWDFEMHQVYRVSGSRDVEDGSVEATLSLGELSQGRTFKRLPEAAGAGRRGAHRPGGPGFRLHPRQRPLQRRRARPGHLPGFPHPSPLRRTPSGPLARPLRRRRRRGARGRFQPRHL